MTARRPGRPRAEAGLDEAALDAAALALLDEGAEVTVRGVARRLAVTPMAVSQRVGGLDGLLARVVVAAHAGFVPPEAEAEGPEEVAQAVLTYAAAARRHPGAVMLAFARPDLLAPSLVAFTDWLRRQVARSDPAGAEAGVALLVDYAHGHLLAAPSGADAAMEAIFRDNLRRLAGWIMGGAGSAPRSSA